MKFLDIDKGKFVTMNAEEIKAALSKGPRYPEITVELTGVDGNAFSIMGVVSKALRRGGVPKDQITEFVEEATSGNYDHVIQTCMAWVEVT